MKNARKQPQRVPPPLLSGNERTEGQGILDEFSGDDAMVLWKTYRSVRLWTELESAERKQLVSAEALANRLEHIAVAPGLREVESDLVALAEMYHKPITRTTVVARCRAIEGWAEERGAGRTALEFGQLAALANPNDAGTAVRVAKRGRDLAEYARAESWYWQAIVRARKRADWQAYVMSMLGLALTHALRGNLPAAGRNLERGLRRARRQGLRREEGMVLHELTVLAIRMDKLKKVVFYGRQAAQVYGADHPRLPALSHDVAIFWMNRGYFRPALDVVRAIPEDYGTPADQLSRAASIARAAGVTRSRDLFYCTAEEAERLLENPVAASRAANALLDISRGALSLGDVELAIDLATRAERLAIDRAQAEQRLEAEALLDEARRSGALSTVRRRRAPAEVLDFTSDLIESLAAPALTTA